MRETAVRAQSYKVGIVVDRNYGDRILELASSFHLWAVESPSNTPTIQRFWAIAHPEPDADPLGPGITSFKAPETESAEEMCARIAGDIDEHHGEFAHDPPWSEIAVYGVTLNGRLRDVFAELGATEFAPTQDGFICRR
jgi:hypothetical protein